MPDNRIVEDFSQWTNFSESVERMNSMRVFPVSMKRVSSGGFYTESNTAFVADIVIESELSDSQH